MTVKRKLWLHVGLPKTATTAFQSWMRQNTQTLAEQGISYPSQFGVGTDKHNFIVSWLKNNRNLKKLSNLLNSSQAELILLSNEGLSNHLDDFDEKALSKFRELTQDWDVGIILVTRDPKAWTRSYHKQCVLNPNNGGSPVWGTSLTVAEISKHPRIRRFLETEHLMDDLKSAFGARDIKRFNFDSPDWFQSCLETLGIESEGLPTLPRTNQSLPDWAIELLRRVNALTGDQASRNGWKLALQSHLGSNHTILTNLSRSEDVHIDLDMRKAISETYGDFAGRDDSDAQTFLMTLNPQ